MALDDLAFHLKLYHRDRLMHFRHQSRIYHVIDILIQNMWFKPGTWVIPVCRGRKHRKRTQINSITIFQHIKAVITDGDPQHITHTGQVASCRSHPGDIMISPLDIYVMEIHQFI